MNQKNNQQFLGILFPDNIEAGDLEILREATTDQPGLIRLVKAQIGKNDGATNSLPLLSNKGGKIGFVADTDLMMSPFDTTYVIMQYEDESVTTNDKNGGSK